MLQASILETIKSMVGIDSTNNDFDTELVLWINSAIFELLQVGVGLSYSFRITGNSETWEDFIGTRWDIEGVKSYICLNVRKNFDPPTSGILMGAIDKECEKLIWRLSVADTINNV